MTEIQTMRAALIPQVRHEAIRLIASRVDPSDVRYYMGGGMQGFGLFRQRDGAPRVVVWSGFFGGCWAQVMEPGKPRWEAHAMVRVYLGGPFSDVGRALRKLGRYLHHREAEAEEEAAALRIRRSLESISAVAVEIPGAGSLALADRSLVEPSCPTCGRKS